MTLVSNYRIFVNDEPLNYENTDLQECQLDFLKTREHLGPRSDWELALALDKFDFAIKVTREKGLLVAKPA